MTPPKVVDLHPPEPADPGVETGCAGLIWTGERVQDIPGRWALVGRHPGQLGSFADRLDLRFASGDTDPEELVKEIARRLMRPDPFPYEGKEEGA